MEHKIIVNLNTLKLPLTGIGYYTFNIVKFLLQKDVIIVGIRNNQILTQQQINSLIHRLSSTSVITHNFKHSNIKSFIINCIKKMPKVYLVKHKIESIILNLKLKSYAENNFIYFEPNFVPFSYTGKIITTIHDLSFIHHPEFHPKERVNYLTAQLPNIMKNSTKIVVDSDTIREKLIHLYPSYKNKIITLYLGVNPDFCSNRRDDILLSKLNLKEKSYILSVCTLEPRKNLLSLVKAYRQLPEQIKNKYPLVLVGHKGWKNSELFSYLEELIIKKQAVITGYLSDEAVKVIYSSAKVFVYPSLYEGFGLPIIEAMASGTPVITSNYGAMAEVAGNAAMLVDPSSIEQISSAIMQLLEEESLYTNLVQSGLNRASYFHWEKTVDNLISIMNN
ncbi:glycosyltransferase family 4 protein [Gallibacterium salpingitidis]|uniref:Glycosyl transferase n=1 Tax=Gallibacterium salpingitidis TaxID=505341 RepID=A0A1A7P232_9PAST|nr:glycosyltransferase family 1 protein [Gallibacterium salpingitidis]OBW95289.1 glycosyl transferase [Gallibacterium salpingitidis]